MEILIEIITHIDTLFWVVAAVLMVEIGVVLMLFWAFKPLLDEQTERHAADRARWASERERLRRWSSRHDSSR